MDEISEYDAPEAAAEDISEPASVNEMTITKKFYFEGMYAATNFKSSVVRTALVLLAVFAAALLFSQMAGIGSGSIAGEAALMAVLALYVLVIVPRRKYAAGYKTMRNQSEGDLHRTVEF